MLGIEIYKVKKTTFLSTIMKIIFPENANLYNLRDYNPFKSDHVHMGDQNR